MKKKTRIIILLCIVLALAFGWVRFKTGLRADMEKTLSTRYPSDTFNVKDVQLNLIPPGAKGIATAQKEKLDFDVSIVKMFGTPDKVTDNLYEARSRKHYEDLIKKRMEPLKSQITSYRLDLVTVGDKSINKDTGLYPGTLTILLSHQVATGDAYIKKVKELADNIAQNPIQGIDSYKFISFPGEVKTSEIAKYGFTKDVLVMPTPSPSPSPTPRLTTSPKDAGQTKTTTANPTTTAVTKEAVMPAAPAFAFQFTLMKERLQVDLDQIQNGMRVITFTTKELKKMAEELSLSAKDEELILDADKRQKDAAVSQTTTVKK